MSLVDFTSNSLWLNMGLFAIAAVVIWLAGTRLERYADSIAIKTGLGRALLGLLLLAAATSLPEVATVVTASLTGNTTLAVHNLLGSVIVNTAILALADLTIKRAALSHESPKFALLMQGVGLNFVLAMMLMGMTLSEQLRLQLPLLGTNLSVGLWSLLLLASYLLMLYTTYRAQGHPRWQPVEQGGANGSHTPDGGSDQPKDREENQSVRRLGVYFAIGSAVVLVAGWLVAQTGDALAQQTGLGASFVGFTLVAIATSLPEVSTTVSAARAGNSEMAFSNVFGSNAFTVSLLVLVGLLAGGPAVLASMTASGQFAAALGILMTCIYLWGLLEREDRTVLRMGWDSTAVVICAAAGFAIFYWVK